RKHLRRRGALACAPAPAPIRRGAERGGNRGAPPRDPDCLEGGDCTPRRDAQQLPDSGWKPGADAGGVQGLRPRGRTVRALRDADREDSGGRPRHVVLPVLPALSLPGTPRKALLTRRSATGFECERADRPTRRGNGVENERAGTSPALLVPRAVWVSGRDPLELAAAIELPELGIAADRPAVDEDLRDGPAAGQVEQALAERRVVVERDLLVLEPACVQQRLGADAVGAPAGRVHLDPRHLRVQTQKTSRRFPAWPVSTLEPRGRPLVQDRGRGAALLSFRRGGSRTSPLH